MKRILIIGGGFAGLWSAASAARQLEALGEAADITLINPDPWHSIRVRNYESDLSDTQVDLASVLAPIDVTLLIGKATLIDHRSQVVHTDVEGDSKRLHYDKLILASGSHLMRPDTAGVNKFTFDVDSYRAALRLQQHIDNLSTISVRTGRYTALVIGSGATGVELACELPARLRASALASNDPTAVEQVRVILADRGPTIAGRLGGGQPVIERACRELGIELMTNFALSSVDSEGALLTDGTRLPAATVIWCAGMQANELTECIDADRDTQGRLKVDDCMRVIGLDNVFAAGDVAHALIDGERPSVMSCQHARPMGRFAGHNAVNELFGLPLEPLNIDWYTNIIDLGPWGAVYTQGWSRVAVAQGMEAKNTKSLINRERIYPPRSGTREQILAAAALDLQRPPQLKPIG
ncbi:FAD-dependent oxidoreductase [Pseudomonas tolaasii]|uniref:NAD(P)/FAD-dependent oxidoreductase n=1 Tax=Pseudomonas tolaasii TaxID=29442 RepID=UPI0015A44857|nr:FAD-dependent oxidoreductase [Pseudomonas tolaasii]NWC28465.1 FAD-dependent oxidoreductase [Pseudomonas tolaasii]